MPSPGGKPCATSVVSSATTGRRSASACPTSSEIGTVHHGIEPSFATQRAARSERQLRPADEVAGGERVTRARRVERPRRDGGELDRRRSGRRRAALQHPLAAVQRPPTIRSSSSFANTIAGGAPPAARGSARPEVADRAPGGEVDAHARGGARPPAARRRRSASAGASNREGEVRAAVEPGRVELAGVESGETPRSEAIVRAPSAATSETTVPVRPSTTGPRTSTP